MGITCEELKNTQDNSGVYEGNTINKTGNDLSCCLLPHSQHPFFPRLDF